MSSAPDAQNMDPGVARGPGEEPLRAVLQWQQAMLVAATLPDLLAAAARPPGAAAPIAATLLLADPTHELRHLLFGGGSTPLGGLLFTDSLVAMMPQLALLSDPWQGLFRATDHDRLFPGASGIEQVALFPLRARGALIGCLNLGTTGGARVPGDGDPWVLARVGEVMSVVLEHHLDAMRLRRGGFTNPLTGWHTRRFLEARLKEAIARCERHGGDVSCVLIDIDGLKAVNDAYGQIAGDQALREIAARIEGQLRTSDAAAQVDADEFVVLLPDTRVELAVPLAERLLDAVRSEPVQAAPGLLLPMSVSIGLAAITAGSDTGRKALSNHLLAKAESALYMAKSRGGNRYVLADA